MLPNKTGPQRRVVGVSFGSHSFGRAPSIKALFEFIRHRRRFIRLLVVATDGAGVQEGSSYAIISSNLKFPRWLRRRLSTGFELFVSIDVILSFQTGNPSVRR